MIIERELSLRDVRAIAIGAGILGTGGGGNPYLGRLWLEKEMKARGAGPRIIAVEDVPDDAFVCGLSGMGAPTVGIEKLPETEEFVNVVRALEDHIGQQMAALIIGEIGGSNSMRPLVCGLQMGLPIVDGDGMGRAFPELQMDTFIIGGVSASPMALTDSWGNAVLFPNIDSPFRAEAYARALTIQMGGRAALAMPLMTGLQMKNTIIRDTLSLARRIGELVLQTRESHDDPSEAVAALCNGRVLFRGKITDVNRRTTTGFARGEVKLAAFGSANDTMRIVFQNENLVAWHNEEIVCTVPDLICVLNLEDGEPVSTELLRYGLRVSVLGLPAARELKTPEALTIVGPAAFGYDMPFHPLPGHLL